MEKNFSQASVNLHEILKNPGVWDPFILSYVEVGPYILMLVKLCKESNSCAVSLNCFHLVKECLNFN